ncbi:MAG: hypothetical protein CMJ58_12540 [Planctomycetaceae bacterium]|nr:hypothetical protein [Planctomycetaceae bacterium]
MEPQIRCPNCNADIPLTESLAAPLIAATRERYEQRLAELSEKTRAREESLRKEQAELEKARGELDEQVAVRLNEERDRIAGEEAAKARTLLGAELGERDKQLTELKEVLAAREQKLADAQKAQADLIRKQRELDDQKRELELTVERRVQESLQAERAKGKQDAEQEMKLKVAEKEQVIAAMQKQIEDLKKKAEQGSQQLQGEVQELVLEELIGSRFPLDEVTPVPKGEHGGDVLHRVIPAPGVCSGTILWESKRTKNWSDGWLVKLRQDQRAAKADVAIIMSQALPAGVESFDLVDGVWVTSPLTAIPVCIALRTSLIELNKARRSRDGQQSKMELVYDYLTGPQFRHRVNAIVEKFTAMQEDLEKERRTMTRMWAKREEQLRLVVDATAGMYGDLQAIAGAGLAEIEGLAAPLLESDSIQDGE